MNLTIQKDTSQTQIRVINQSFFWMFVGLFITGLTSIVVSSNTGLMNVIYSSNIIFFGLMIAELALVFFLSFRITKMSHEAALLSFFVYSILNGITLSSIFLVYTGVSIASAFFITSAVFGVMAFYGYTTHRDLTTIGNLAFMGLIGLIIASVVNLFLNNGAFSYILSYLSLLIFIGLTAYDTQKIKQMERYTETQNLGILGALTLYLDFINIFLDLLRILGQRRND